MIEAKIPPAELIEFDLALKNLHPEKLLEGEWLPFATDVMLTAANYAPDFPGNTYTRTGHLWESWGRDVESPLSASVFNFALYAGHVQGAEQMAVHAGHGWKKLFDVGLRMAQDFVNMLADKADRIWSD